MRWQEYVAIAKEFNLPHNVMDAWGILNGTNSLSAEMLHKLGFKHAAGVLATWSRSRYGNNEPNLNNYAFAMQSNEAEKYSASRRSA